ncbi:MAG: glycosyltransferase [Anaerolineaceae bacterium]|nr:glycosyltransferase [Anaerolineaceae bacterium]
MSTLGKVAHLTSFHPPYDTRVGCRECRALAEAGYEVVIVAACDPSEAAACDIEVRRIPKPKTRPGRLLVTLPGILRAAMREKARVYHFHDPELIPVGLLLKLCGKKVIYDVHEDVPRQVMTFDFLPPMVRRLVSVCVAATEWVGARCFDRIIAATPTIAARFPPGKTVTIHNYPIADELTTAAPRPYRERPMRVAYVGGLSAYYGLREMVRAMGHLDDLPEARLSLAGRAFSPPELEDQCRQLPGWERVDFVGWRTREQLSAMLDNSRVGLVVIHPTHNYRQAYPTKLFEYMSAGLPVVASDFPVWRQFVESADCAILVDPLDPEAIAGAVRRLLENPDQAEAMGRRGREAIVQSYNWELEAEKLRECYRQLLGR